MILLGTMLHTERGIPDSLPQLCVKRMPLNCPGSLLFVAVAVRSLRSILSIGSDVVGGLVVLNCPLHRLASMFGGAARTLSEEVVFGLVGVGGGVDLPSLH